MDNITNTKITKKDRYEMIQDLIGLAEEVGFEGFNYRELNEFCANEISQLERKAIKAKERSFKIKSAYDDLYDMVYDALTDEPLTKDEIAARVREAHPNETYTTIGRIVTRLASLYKKGLVIKESVSVGKTGERHKVMTYRKNPNN